MPPRSRAERRSAARGAILDAAHALIAEGGYAAAGVTDVARRAGVATGSIYRHFPSKGDLFAEVFDQAASRELALVTEILAAPSRPATERLAAAVEAFVRRALAAPRLAYALMAEPVDPAVERARLANKRAERDVFARLLEQGVAAGEIPPLDAPLVASAIVGALQEALIGPLAEQRSSDALVASLVTFAVNATGARGDRAFAETARADATEETTEEEPHGRRAAHRAVDHA